MTRKSNTDTNALTTLIQEEYHRRDATGAARIRAHEMALAVYERIDVDSIAPILVRVAALLELQQLSRLALRDNSGADQIEVEQAELFSFKLQKRYPTSDGYTLRSHLTLSERRTNSDRLRKEGAMKVHHANTLDAETDHLVRTGKLSDTTEVNATVPTN